MASEKEIALEQALIAVMAAARDLDICRHIAEKAISGLLADDPRYRWVGHPHFTNAIDEIKLASGGDIDWQDVGNG